jgi:zinc protease
MRAPVVTHMVWYKVGSADEPRGKSGIAHYLEHLMFKGTERRAPGEFNRVVASHGGRDNAFTSWDYTGYFQDIAADRLEVVMEMEADRMANLRLSAEVARPELDVVLEERRSRTDSSPAGLLAEQARAALFLNHPYRLPIIGWEHEIRGLDHRDALDFHATWYAPNNAILVVAGGVTAATVRTLAERHFGPIPARPVPPRKRLAEPPRAADTRLHMISPQVRQASWSRRWLAPSYNAGESAHVLPLQVAAEILSGGAGTRLERRLVKGERLALSAGADFDGTAVDLGQFTIYAQPTGDVGRLEAAIDAELARLADDGPSVAEVERAVRRLRSAAIYAQDSLSGAARVLGVALATGGGVAQVEEWPARLGGVTPDAVRRAVAAILRGQPSVTSLLEPKRPS